MSIEGEGAAELMACVSEMEEMMGVSQPSALRILGEVCGPVLEQRLGEKMYALDQSQWEEGATAEAAEAIQDWVDGMRIPRAVFNKVSPLPSIARTG